MRCHRASVSPRRNQDRPPSYDLESLRESERISLMPQDLARTPTFRCHARLPHLLNKRRSAGGWLNLDIGSVFGIGQRAATSAVQRAAATRRRESQPPLV